MVLGQQITVELGPLKHVFLLVVVGHERDLLARSHGNRFVGHPCCSFRGAWTQGSLNSTCAIGAGNTACEWNISRMPDLQSTMVTSPIRVVAVDIDGTLTDPQFHVSERNVAALRAAHTAGIEIILATGRRHDYAMPIARELGVPVLLISSNGALVRSSDGQSLFTECLAA